MGRLVIMFAFVRIWRRRKTLFVTDDNYAVAVSHVCKALTQSRKLRSLLFN